MATPEQHLEQAGANRSHAEYLLEHASADPTAMQWAVTAAFYCAVHCMQAHLARNGVTPRSHAQRENLLADPRYGVPNDVFRAYGHLRWRSEGVRYYLRRVTSERVRTEVLDTLLAKITAFVGL